MAKRNMSLDGYTDSMKEHKKILEEIVIEHKGLEWYRLCGGREKYLCLEYHGKPILVLEGKKCVGFGQLGTRCSDSQIIGNPLSIKISKEPDPEPETIFSRYRYRSGWSHPYTIRFDSYEKIKPEIERILSVAIRKL